MKKKLWLNENSTFKNAKKVWVLFWSLGKEQARSNASVGYTHNLPLAMSEPVLIRLL